MRKGGEEERNGEKEGRGGGNFGKKGTGTDLDVSEEGGGEGVRLWTER